MRQVTILSRRARPMLHQLPDKVVFVVIVPRLHRAKQPFEFAAGSGYAGINARARGRRHAQIRSCLYA